MVSFTVYYYGCTYFYIYYTCTKVGERDSWLASHRRLPSVENEPVLLDRKVTLLLETVAPQEMHTLNENYTREQLCVEERDRGVEK